MKTAEDYLIDATAKTATYLSDHLQEDILKAMQEYALEAIKADRERIKQFAEVEQFYNCGCYHPCHCARVDFKSIDNTPIELK